MDPRPAGGQPPPGGEGREVLSSTAADGAQGLKENRGQFLLLLLAIVLAALVTGPERSVLPVLGREEFGVGTTTATLSFLVAFGVAKAIANFLAGDLADRVGRKRVLMIGWLAALPVAPLIMLAPSWSWVVAANVLLGTASAFIWSSSVVMRLDLVGPKRRGLAMGLSGAGPMAMGATALLAGWLAQRYDPRPAPFIIAAVAAVVGLLLAMRVRDTEAKAEAEEDGLEARSGGTEGEPAADAAPDGRLARLRWGSWTNDQLLGSNQAGLALNMTDGVVWGIFPLFLTRQGLGLQEVGLIAGVYPMVVGLVEGGAGSISDRIGRKPLIVGGMLLMAGALAAFAFVSGLVAWLVLAGIMGIGYAAAFPNLSAHVGDAVAPRSRPAAIGVYRMWRDLGHAVGAVVAGLLTDVVGFRWAMAMMAAVLAGSAVVARWRLARLEP